MPNGMWPCDTRKLSNCRYIFDLNNILIPLNIVLIASATCTVRWILCTLHTSTRSTIFVIITIRGTKHSKKKTEHTWRWDAMFWAWTRKSHVIDVVFLPHSCLVAVTILCLFFFLFCICFFSFSVYLTHADDLILFYYIILYVLYMRKKTQQNDRQHDVHACPIVCSHLSVNSRNKRMLAPTTSEKERAMTDTSKIISSFQSERARASRNASNNCSSTTTAANAKSKKRLTLFFFLLWSIQE